VGVFFFALYAAICGKKCSRCILGVLFVIFFLVFMAFGFAILLELDWIRYTACMNVWTNERSKEAAFELDKALGCRCWRDRDQHDVCLEGENVTIPYKKNCFDVLDPQWDRVYVIAFVFAGFLFIGVVCAWAYVCCRSSGKKHDGITYRAYYDYV
jgi:hypothetical protein